MFCEYLWIFYINILSCGVFSEWEADGNFLTRVSGSEKYSIFRPGGINMTNYTKPVWALLGKALSCSHARHGPSQWASTPSLRLDWKTWKTTGRKTEKEWNKQTNKHIIVDLSIYAVDCVNCLSRSWRFWSLDRQNSGGHQPSKRGIWPTRNNEGVWPTRNNERLFWRDLTQTWGAFWGNSLPALF